MALSDSIVWFAPPAWDPFFDAAIACIGLEAANADFVWILSAGAWTSAAELLLPDGWRVMPAIQHRDGSWAVSLINDQIDGVVTGKGATLSCAMVVACLKVRGL